MLWVMPISKITQPAEVGGSSSEPASRDDPTIPSGGRDGEEHGAVPAGAILNEDGQVLDAMRVMNTSVRRALRSLALATVVLSTLWQSVGVVAAQAVTVSVRPEREGPDVNTSVLRGFNFGNWMAVTEMREQLARVPADALRFPGGNIGDEQDLDAASLNVLASLLPLVAGKRELLMQTRVFQGIGDRAAANRPEDAFNALRLARERGMTVSYWEIGNEPDLFGINRGDPTWTPERYCAAFRAQALALKAADPTIKVAGPAVSGAEQRADEFLTRFVELCGDTVDLLTWHIYPTDGSKGEDEALESVRAIDRDMAKYRALWRDPRRNPRGHARDIDFGITEYGLSWRTSSPRFLSDQAGALWAAEAALRMARGGLKVAHYFAYQGTGFHGLLDGAGAPRPTFYAFEVLGRLTGRFVEAASSDSRVWAHAVRQGGAVDLLLINSRRTPISIDLDVGAMRAQDVRYFDQGIVDEELPMATLPIPSGAAPLTLPAMSLVLLRMVTAP
jgi:hypothetical protein